MYIYQYANYWSNAVMDKTIDEIRLINLDSLKEESGLRWVDIAQKIETDPAYLSQLRSKKTARNMGNEIARRLEIEFNKPNGWMDALHPEDECKTEPVKQDINDYLIELCNVCDDMIDHQKLFPDECRLWLYKEARAMAKKHNPLPTMEKLELLLLEMAEEKDKH